MKLVVFTDLDATLLDPRTYSYDPAREALDALRHREAALVLVSSKTFAEMAPLHKQLRLTEPFVVENGGAIASYPEAAIGSALKQLPIQAEPIRKDDFLMIPLGASYAMLVKSLREISIETGLHLTGFSTMRNEDVVALTGLTADEAEKARQRDFDEPFILQDPTSGNEDRITNAAQQRGLTVVLGGRFWHLVGHEGKGKAVTLLIEAYRSLYGRICTVGLGDSPNDYSFLDLMDVPVLVGQARPQEASFASEARARLIPQAGPTGWNLAILQILSEQ